MKPEKGWLLVTQQLFKPIFHNMPKALKSCILLYQDNDTEGSIISEGKFSKAGTMLFFLRTALLPRLYLL